MNKNADPGEAGQIRDDNGLRLAFAREAIRNGRLPARPADRLSKGRSNSARCAICEMPLPKDELGCKLEYAQKGRDWTSHYLHAQCFLAWESECRGAESAGSGPNGHGSRDDGSPATNGRDPGRGKEPA
jgi:hypothetical protein